MDNVISIFDHVSEKLKTLHQKNLPSWAMREVEKRANRYASAFHRNETWLNSVEAMFHRYGINRIEKQ
jgi:hypothetical protein